MNKIYNYLFKNNYQPKNAGLIDKHIIYPVSNLFSKPAKKIGITPNQITLLTLFLRSVAIYNMYYKINFNLIFSLFLISWFTDALDGIVARKYKMHSYIGSILDSVVDALTVKITFIVLYVKYYQDNPLHLSIFSFSLLLYLLVTVIKLKQNKKNTLKIWEKILVNIPINFNKNIYIFQFVDPGLAYLIFMFCIYYTLFIKV